MDLRAALRSSRLTVVGPVAAACLDGPVIHRGLAHGKSLSNSAPLPSKSPGKGVALCSQLKTDG